MEYLIVRYGEIGTKSYSVQQKMVQTLRQRVADRLEYEGIDYGKVSTRKGRIIAGSVDAETAARQVKELPGVSSVSPAKKCENEMDGIKELAATFEIEDTFGVKTKRSADVDFDSMDVNREVGAHIEKEAGATVDLDSPDTWIRIEVRDVGTFVFTEKIEGPNGFPAGSAGELAALVSGGIDSPVAAYEIMKRGAEITPVYFYNSPLAAEDHLMRLESVLKELKRFNPSKKWSYHLVDMKEVNEKLMEEVEKGRMMVHRAIMFRVAEKIVEKEGLSGVVTGESMGQKSSQTVTNLNTTSGEIDIPVHRPLLTLSKNEIVEKARQIGTFELSEIDSACRSISPQSPATRMGREELEKLSGRVDIEGLVAKALENVEIKEID